MAVLYARVAGAWVPIGGSGSFLPLSGGTLTGPLILAADPATALGAATKQYIDTRMAQAGPFQYATSNSGSATTSTSFVTWATVTNGLTVPAWATTAIITVFMTAIKNSAAAVALYSFDATLSGGSYITDRAAIGLVNTSDNISTGFVASVGSPVTGSGRSVLIGAKRISGSGIAVSDSVTKMTVSVSFT